ncbi:hypothetical protein [Streptomyces avermitilis]|uniref:hypothetical protein n=1 Tax=Streptomyces avermitilis TaxID=33903 RepID=UPI00381B5A43
MVVYTSVRRHARVLAAFAAAASLTGAAVHSATAAPTTALNRPALAKQILRTSGISLATIHPDRNHRNSHPASTPKGNITDTANGKNALTSPWGDKANRRVPLDARMLNGMLKVRTQYNLRISVSEIVGGDHSSNSRHYAGKAFDVNVINGKHVGSGAPHKALMSACRKLGATEVLGPGDPGHKTHVHCAWPR